MNKYTYHGKIGGTYACVIAKGDHFGVTPADIWEVLTKRKEPDDLTWKLQVQIGIVTEELNARFFTHKSRLEVDRSDRACRVWEHPEHDFAVCQPDGIIGKTGLFEAKHTGQFNDWQKLLKTYYPQIQHNMACTGTNIAYMSVIFSNNRIEYEVIKRDREYISSLMAREKAFWEHVIMDVPPEGYNDPLTPKIPPMKTVDMEGNNLWANFAIDFAEHQAASNKFSDAKDGLKEMAPKDARITTGHGITVSRNKRGAATVKVDAT